MKAFVPADELIGEGEAMHESSLLQPEDTAEAALQQYFGQICYHMSKVVHWDGLHTS